MFQDRENISDNSSGVLAVEWRFMTQRTDNTAGICPSHLKFAYVRHLWIWLPIAALALNLAGLVPALHWRQAQMRQVASEHISQNQEHDLTALCLNWSETKTLRWVEDAPHMECWHDGNLYDVAAIDTVSSGLVLHVYHDSKEQSLLHQFSEWVKRMNGPGSNDGVYNQLLSFLQNLTVPPSSSLLQQGPAGLIAQIPETDSPLPNGWLSVPTPPPQYA